MDVKLIYKTECLAEYLCAYVTKTEKASKQVICQNLVKVLYFCLCAGRLCELCVQQQVCKMMLQTVQK
jgi:hypothetical protein